MHTALRHSYVRFCLGVVLVALLCAAVAGASRVTFNSTRSMPLGFYRTESLQQRPLARGQIVEYCPSLAIARLGLAREYLARGACGSGSAYLLKIVVGVRGDRVRLRADGVWINGRRLAGSRTFARDAASRPLPHVKRGVYVLRANELWLSTPNSRSWDSRYYGPVRTSDVVGTAHLWLAV